MSNHFPIIPGLYGFGTETRAAYGAKHDPVIFIVTDLTTRNGALGNSTRNGVAVKTGSFLEAINYTPPANTGKVILFEVSGTINAVSAPYTYRIDHSYTTIAGQTSPSPGINLRNIALGCLSHDVLVQHIRSRVGDAMNGVKPDNRHPMEITCMVGHGDVYNVVYDHCSGSWAIDSGGLFWEEGGHHAYNCTWSNSIFSEALDDSLHRKGPHSKGPCIQTDTSNFSFINNLMVSNDARNPYLRRATNVIVNNYIYNPGYASTQIEIISGSIISSIVGNLIEGGPSSDSNAYQNHFSSKAMTVTSDIYLHNNKCGKEGVGWYTQTSANDWSHVRWWGGLSDMSDQIKVLSSPIWPTDLVAMDVDDVKSYVLANAGARPADRDSADQRVVDHALSGGTQGQIINCVEADGSTRCQKNAGGWPILAENGITLDIPANPHQDSGNGYTNLEIWLHRLAAEVEGISNPCAGIICPNVCIGNDLWSQKCVDGICVADQLLATNSTNCGYDPCTGVFCPNTCVGPDLWSQRCYPDTGLCITDQLLQEDSLNCTISDAVPTDDSNIATYLVIGGLGLTGLAMLLIKKRR